MHRIKIRMAKLTAVATSALLKTLGKDETPMDNTVLYRIVCHRDRKIIP